MKDRKKKAVNFHMPELGIGKRILLYIATILTGALTIISMLVEISALAWEYVSYLLYAIAACCLFLSCWYLTLDIRYVIKERLKPAIHANTFTDKISTDYRYSTFLFAIPGFGMSIAFAVFNGAIAIYSWSYWYLTLAVYYFLLSVMRYGSLRMERRLSKAAYSKALKLREWKAYRNCGILLMLMNIVMVGIVLLTMFQDTGKRYPGFLIYAVAAYTFHKITKAVINVVRAGKIKAPLLMTIRSIGYADALVSLLSLQTAMFVSFPTQEPLLEKIMNIGTGMAVCLMIFGIGIGMITNGQKHIRNIITNKGA